MSGNTNKENRVKMLKARVNAIRELKKMPSKIMIGAFHFWHLTDPNNYYTKVTKKGVTLFMRRYKDATEYNELVPVVTLTCEVSEAIKQINLHIKECAALSGK